MHLNNYNMDNNLFSIDEIVKYYNKLVAQETVLEDNPNLPTQEDLELYQKLLIDKAYFRSLADPAKIGFALGLMYEKKPKTNEPY